MNFKESYINELYELMEKNLHKIFNNSSLL